MRKNTVEGKAKPTPSLPEAVAGNASAPVGEKRQPSGVGEPHAPCCVYCGLYQESAALTAAREVGEGLREASETLQANTPCAHCHNGSIRSRLGWHYWGDGSRSKCLDEPALAAPAPQPALLDYADYAKRAAGLAEQFEEMFTRMSPPPREEVKRQLYDLLVEIDRGIWERVADKLTAPKPAPPQHTDDVWVDGMAQAMKLKLAQKRGEGYSGWDQPAECSVEHLANLLLKHMDKPDMIDIANFAMMLHFRIGGGDALVAAFKLVRRAADLEGRLNTGADFPS